MAARAWVVRWFGEGVARSIEQFVEGNLFGDEFITCPQCQTPVAATLMAEWRMCPICRKSATNETMIEALKARRAAALEASSAANKQVEEIERELLVMRKKG